MVGEIRAFLEELAGRAEKIPKVFSFSSSKLQGEESLLGSPGWEGSGAAVACQDTELCRSWGQFLKEVLADTHLPSCTHLPHTGTGTVTQWKGTGWPCPPIPLPWHPVGIALPKAPKPLKPGRSQKSQCGLGSFMKRYKGKYCHLNNDSFTLLQLFFYQYFDVFTYSHYKWLIPVPRHQPEPPLVIFWPQAGVIKLIKVLTLKGTSKGT